LTGFSRLYDPEEFSKGKRKRVWSGMWKPRRRGKAIIPSSIRKKMRFKPGDNLGFIINEKGFLEIKKAHLKLEFN